jgi:kynureninase
MSPEFHPAADAGRFLIGTPHVLSLAPLIGSLGLVNRAGVAAIRVKSLALTRFLRGEIETRLADALLDVVTTRVDECRGGHLTLGHREAGKLSRALRARGVIPDFRPPDLLRLCPSPLYTSFAECACAVEILEDILRRGAHNQLPDHDVRVT